MLNKLGVMCQADYITRVTLDRLLASGSPSFVNTATCFGCGENDPESHVPGLREDEFSNWYDIMIRALSSELKLIFLNENLPMVLISYFYYCTKVSYCHQTIE